MRVVEERLRLRTRTRTKCIAMTPYTSVHGLSAQATARLSGADFVVPYDFTDGGYTFPKVTVLDPADALGTSATAPSDALTSPWTELAASTGFRRRPSCARGSSDPRRPASKDETSVGRRPSERP